MRSIRWGMIPAVLLTVGWVLAQPAPQTTRPMTFMDVMEMRAVGGGQLAPDGARVVYTVSIPHWKSGKNYTDVFVAEASTGVSRQMTFTREKNETAPQWARDGKRFAFLSDREGSQQIYLMAVDGGEARKLTEAKDGVHAFAFSRDGNWLAFSGGKVEDRQLSLVDLASEDCAVTALSKHATPIRDFAFCGGGRADFLHQPRPTRQGRREAEGEEVRRAHRRSRAISGASLVLGFEGQGRETLD